jgi:protein-serine/threonine kinase
MERDDSQNGNRGNNNNGRLFLNFDNNNNRFATNDRNYPTTPSTFPQPVFPSNQPQQQYAQQPQYQSNAPAPNAPAGYFMNNPYPPQYPPQAASSQYQNQPGAPNQGYAPRQGMMNTHDPTNGLAHQFSHQNLGGSGRNSPNVNRQGQGAYRPRTAGATGSNSSNNSFLNAPVPSLPSMPQIEFEVPGKERNNEKYGPTANGNAKRCSQLVSQFFKDNVQRARDRNSR